MIIEQQNEDQKGIFIQKLIARQEGTFEVNLDIRLF